MSRLNIGALPLPARAYRIDLMPEQGRFETKKVARERDGDHAQRLRLTSPTLSREARHKAEALAERLEYHGRGEPAPNSLACALHMRDQKIRVTGALLKLIAETETFSAGAAKVPKSPTSIVRTVTVFLPGAEVSWDDIPKVDPDRLLNGLRAGLYRAGAKDASGWAIFFLEAEAVEHSRRCRFHVHGVVYGGMIDVIDRLRATRSYRKTTVEVSGTTKASFPIRMSRKPLTDLPYAISYSLKAFWKLRWEGVIDGVIRRGREPQRLPEPLHTHALLWMDRHDLADVTLMVGLRVDRNSLVAARLKKRK